MLLALRIANHRSLRDLQTLDLRPTYQRDRPSVNVTAVYGANASGKSNLLSALQFMHDAVTSQHDDWFPGDEIPRQPFLLDNKTRSEPSSYAVDLLIDGVMYTYGFSVDSHVVQEEWLYSYPKKKRRTLFDRHGSDYYFGPTLNRKRSDLLSEMTPPNMLFLATAARTLEPDLLIVVEWFRHNLWLISELNQGLLRAMTRELLEDPATARQVIELLQAADLGISNVRVQAQIGSGKGKNSRGIQVRRPSQSSQAENFIRQVLVTQSPKRMLFTHLGEKPADFDISDESRGTRAWFELVGVTLNALTRGWTLLVDELDTSLHPLLSAELIKLFQNPDTNPRGAQLIFTTHDASLMGRIHGEELLRRDEIWFVEKESTTGASQLYPLTDFHPREGLNWERRYLGGALGAVPILDEDRFIDMFAPTDRDA
ncbi:ATP/GTP-binding protein [Microbispora rosea]|uniref:ATP/GTP-binding protein n=1 Tax=Microbispora rosea TaxID=58117 RepID=UPI0037A6D733